MKFDQKFYDIHVLVCTNEKKDSSGCGPKGGQDVVDELKDWSKREFHDEFKKLTGAKSDLDIRVNKSGCLGRCKEAIVCAIYPESEWIVEAKPSDLPEIKERILKVAAKRLNGE